MPSFQRTNAGIDLIRDLGVMTAMTHEKKEEPRSSLVEFKPRGMELSNRPQVKPGMRTDLCKDTFEETYPEFAWMTKI